MMIRVFIVFLLICFFVVSRGAGLWEDRVRCYVELVRVEIVIAPSLSTLPLELSGRLFPLVQDESSSKLSRAEGFFDFEEKTSDEVNNYYRLGLVRDQYKSLLSANHMVNNQVLQLLLNNGLKEVEMIELVHKGLLDIKTPYSAHLFCELWRPGLRPE